MPFVGPTILSGETEGRTACPTGLSGPQRPSPRRPLRACGIALALLTLATGCSPQRSEGPPAFARQDCRAYTVTPGRVSAFASADTITLVQTAGSASKLCAYQVENGGLAHRLTVTLPQAIKGIAGGQNPGPLVGFSDKALFEVEVRGRTWRELWSAPHHILGVTWCRPPASLGPQLLVLTAERIAGQRPLRSHLYALDPQDIRSARVLSPEAGYNFWHLSVGDVDGDGKQEVALCTWSYTATDPNYARRFFVYGWDDEGDLLPRWRGSRLCRPYEWAELVDINSDGVAELVSVETGLKGGKLICTYEWNQFGFWGMGRTEEYVAVSAPQFGDLDGDGRKEIIAIVTGRDGSRRPCAFSHKDSAWRLTHCGDALAQDEAIIVASCDACLEGPPEAASYAVEVGPARLRPIPMTACEESGRDES